MNAQMERPRGYTSLEEADTLHHNVPLQPEGESHEEHHGEKKSVLKKVKAKAKKIKDTLKGHVEHGNELDHAHDEEGEDDDEEEMETDPEVHGSYSTQTYISVQQGAPTNQGHSPMEGVTHTPPLNTTGDPTLTAYIPGTLLPVSAPAVPPADYQTFDPSTTSYVPGQEETLSHSRTDIGAQTGFREEPVAPKSTPVGVPDTDEHDTTMPRELKREDREAFDLHSGGTHGHGTDALRTEQLGSRRPEHVPVAAGSVGTHDACGLETGKHGVSSEIGSTLERGKHLEKDPNAPKDEWEVHEPENYQTKVTDPTSMGSKEIGVTPILHQLDKMKLESDDNQKTGQDETLFKPSTDCDMAPSFEATEETLPKSSSEPNMAPSDAKLSMGSNDQFAAEPITPLTPAFVHEPETQLDATQGSDMSSDQQESYTEKISSAATAVADKARQATSAVTSKLGYGATTEKHDTQQQLENSSYGEKISNVAAAMATTVQGKLAPVYDKVAEVGSTVASKVPTVASKVHSSGTESSTEEVSSPDKGVSVKEYLAEKLKPGEEEKALSEVITEALPLHKQKEDKEDVKVRVSETEVVTKPNVKVRVTESEEVKNRLGEFDETSPENVGSGSSSPGKAVLDRIYDAATSWFGKGGETQPMSRGFRDNPEGNEPESTTERINQENRDL